MRLMRRSPLAVYIRVMDLCLTRNIFTDKVGFPSLVPVELYSLCIGNVAGCSIQMTNIVRCSRVNNYEKSLTAFVFCIKQAL